MNDDQSFDRFFLGFHVFRRLISDRKPNLRVEKNIYAKVFAYNQLFFAGGLRVDDCTIDSNMAKLEAKWREFILIQSERSEHGKRALVDRSTGEAKIVFSEAKYYRSAVFEQDVARFFGAVAAEPIGQPDLG